jgi:hypothetical protein
VTTGARHLNDLHRSETDQQRHRRGDAECDRNRDLVRIPGRVEQHQRADHEGDGARERERAVADHEGLGDEEAGG